MSAVLRLPGWVGERHWVCLCPRPNNLLDQSWKGCPDCKAVRPPEPDPQPARVGREP